MVEALFQNPAQALRTLESRRGQTALRVTFPGGKSRGVLRVRFETETVLMVLRRNVLVAAHEAAALDALGEECGEVPRLIDRFGNVVVQSDLGERRLPSVFRNMPARKVSALLKPAIGSLVRIQAAGNRAGLPEAAAARKVPKPDVPPLSKSLSDLSARLDLAMPDLDTGEIERRLDAGGTDFVCGDRRTGNAILSRDGRIRWFDFETWRAAPREADFADILADEQIPLGPEDILRLIRDAGSDAGDGERALDLEELSLRVVGAVVNRLNRMLKSAVEKGWKAPILVAAHDWMAASPEASLRLVATGRYFAPEYPATAALEPMLAQIAKALETCLDAPRGRPRHLAEVLGKPELSRLPGPGMSRRR